MGKHLTRIIIIVFFAGFIISIVVLFLLIQFVPKPPVREVERARVAISLARRSEADTYSKKLFTEATISYDSAMVNWQNENKRFLYFRDYEKVATYARLSAKKAELSENNSINSSSELKIRISAKIDSLNNLIAEINELFSNYPFTFEIRDRISKGKFYLKEAEIAYSYEKYLQASLKLGDSEYLLTEAYKNTNENLKIYFRSFSIWKNWIDKALNDSKKQMNYSIIIDKFSRKCFIYLNGIKKYEFDAELGTNWIGDKRVKGDKATPEGMYKVIKKNEGKMTGYYKALIFDYPNDEDKRKFISEIEHGSLPSTADIGSMIEIHGNGGKGIDWTDGCIALTDKDMDTVYKIAEIGTPVTIVGSMVDLISSEKR